jgi:hypothetical protein
MPCPPPLYLSTLHQRRISWSGEKRAPLYITRNDEFQPGVWDYQRYCRLVVIVSLCIVIPQPDLASVVERADYKTEFRFVCAGIRQRRR